MALSEQRKEYLYDYQKTKLKRIPLDVPKEKYEQIKAAADAVGEKVNGYIKKAVDERMERDQIGQQDTGAEWSSGAYIGGSDGGTKMELIKCADHTKGAKSIILMYIV